jgi:hypothetical protein
MHIEAVGQQLDDGLLHADMGLRAADDDLGTAARFQLSDEGLVAAAAEGHFLDTGRGRRSLLQFAQGRAQAFDVLLGEDHRQRQFVRAFQQDAGIPDQLAQGSLIHGGGELLLHIDDDQHGSCRLEQKPVADGHDFSND